MLWRREQACELFLELWYSTEQIEAREDEEDEMLKWLTGAEDGTAMTVYEMVYV